MNDIFKFYPWYSLIFLIIITIFIIIKSYNKKNISYIIFLSLFMTIFPYIIYKLKLTKYSTYQLISLTGNTFDIKILNTAIIFLIEFILYFSIFKLSKLILKIKDNKIIYTTFMFIMTLIVQIILWFIMKYLWLYLIKGIHFDTSYWYSLTILFLLEIFITIRSYENDEIIYAIPLAIINVIYPIYFHYLDFKWYKHLSYSIINLFIIFIIQYILCYILLKITNKFINRNDHKIIYVLLFTILNIIFQIIFGLILSLF